MLLSFILLIPTLNSIDGAKILGVFPTPSISHQLALRPLVQELARRGHEVTVITPNPAFPKGQAPKNLREIDVHNISYDRREEYIEPFSTGDLKDVIRVMKAAVEFFKTIIELQLSVPEVQALINNKNETFDLILLEHCIRSGLIFSHLYKAPVIYVSSFGSMMSTFDIVGAPTHPILYGSMIRYKLVNLTIWDRLSELYIYYYYNDMYERHAAKENAMLRRMFGEDTPGVEELSKNVVMVFLNVHPIWEDNRPVPPNVIFMGGVHQTPEKKLPQDLQKYLDSSKHGVIYFSMGTNVVPSALPPERIQIFLKVFSKLPYDVLWKFNKDDLPGQPANVKLKKWLPQADLLRHPKIKVFITQGGLQSTDEAITAGVPLLGIPMLADQWFNVERYVQLKIGVRLDFKDISEDSLKNAILSLIEDKSYRENIEKLREVLADQPQRPVERAAWWTEHVLRHGAEHLKSPAANMSWTQYYEIQLVSLLLAGLVTAVSIVIFIVYILWKFINVTPVKVKKC
ncbi:UDP-glucosyltransferase 2 [Manduca sexta]|uniref:UDP-glucuronosyltransferase n=1 Tax=Manduca sexta TaxID=7130 RepID=A0A921ZNQ2_MANSE|nr:UDP-glucosyltransferase 2 [Manduca sexta]KAG6460584.1 UDP-glycosyltransferase [Manduca sexta]